jgi:hypothetical protein
VANIGYLGTKSIKDSRWLGGLLVVDELGLPVEFKHTEPCTPTGLTRILHGGRLDWHLKLNVIGQPLLNAASSNLALVICDENLLLRLQQKVKIPLALITETDQQPMQDLGKIEESGAGRWLVSYSATASPVFITLADAQGRSVQKIVEALIELAQSIAIVEPLDRLKKALDFVANSKGDSDSK